MIDPNPSGCGTAICLLVISISIIHSINIPLNVVMTKLASLQKLDKTKSASLLYITYYNSVSTWGVAAYYSQDNQLGHPDYGNFLYSYMCTSRINIAALIVYTVSAALWVSLSRVLWPDVEATCINLYWNLGIFQWHYGNFRLDIYMAAQKQKALQCQSCAGICTLQHR